MSKLKLCLRIIFYIARMPFSILMLPMFVFFSVVLGTFILYAFAHDDTSWSVNYGKEVWFDIAGFLFGFDFNKGKNK